MKCLFLDLASHDALLACVTESDVVAAETVHARVSDAELIPLVERILKDADWSYDTLDRIACVIGPGGFTSLRVAVTFANVLADQLGIPTVGVHLSELYQERLAVSGERSDDDVYWLHSTKRNQLFIRGGKYDEPTLIDVDELSTFSWVGELIEEHQALLDSPSVNLRPIDEVLPSVLSKLVYTNDLLTPWYGRGW